jgi:predicted esterase
MPPPQKPPIRIEAPSATAENAATLIFLHGYGDDGEGWTKYVAFFSIFISCFSLALKIAMQLNVTIPADIAEQFHAAGKMTHLTWVFPNTPFSHESGTTAWFEPGSFSALPVGRSTNAASKRKDADWEDEEDQEGILKSLEYVCCLVDEEVKRGVALRRMVVGGFSQGCIISLLLGLGGRYTGRVAGIVGLSGALPSGSTFAKAKALSPSLSQDMGHLSLESGESDKPYIFLAHGTRDFLIPMRFFRKTKERLERLLSDNAEGAEKGKLESHEYNGMGHGTCGQEFFDLCNFLEKVVPAQ